MSEAPRSPIVLPSPAEHADTLRERIYRYVYGDANLYGSLLGLAGVGLLFGGIIGKGWLLIVAGLYAIGAIAAPKRTIDMRLKDDLSPEAMETWLDRAASLVRDDVRKETIERLGSIRDLILAVLPRLKEADAAALSDEDVFTIKECAYRYLPESLSYYLKLPRIYRRYHAIRDGKTAESMLYDQLGLIETRLRDASERLYQADAQGLLTQGRFLEDKLKKPEHLRAL